MVGGTGLYGEEPPASIVGGTALYCGEEPPASIVGGTPLAASAVPQREQWDCPGGFTP